MSTLYGVLTRSGDTCAVRFERDYATSPDDLWSALTEPDRIARWLSPVEPVKGALGPGGEAVVHFDDGDARFAIDTCTPPSSFQVRWRHATHDTVVSAKIQDLGEGGSRLVLVHARLTEKQAPDYAGGWHWHLDTLDGVLAERDADRTDWSALRDHYAAISV